MKIKISKEINVPDKMICHYGRSSCEALTETQNTNVWNKHKSFTMCKDLSLSCLDICEKENDCIVLSAAPKKVPDCQNGVR